MLFFLLVKIKLNWLFYVGKINCLKMKGMRIKNAFIFLVSFCSLSIYAQVEFKEQFTEPAFRFYPKPLYFFNNKAVDSTELLNQMASCKEKCNYSGFGIIPFGKKFEPKYLSNDYLKLYGCALKKAQELDMQMILYDEYGFPSGGAGAINGDDIPRFKLQYPGETTKRLDKIEYEIIQNKELSIQLPEAKIMAVVDFDTITFKRIDLKKSIKNNQLSWKAPKGNWKVLLFICVMDGGPVVDYLDPSAVRNFIKMTHEAYYDHFKNYFGKTITGTFFDEPTLYMAKGRIWTHDFNTKFKQKYGFDPDLYYPALWYNIGQETTEARNYLFGFRSELYAMGFMKEINEWSNQHGVYATGHQDNEEIVNPVSTSGDFMLWTKYLDVPGIDKIGGNRPTEKFYKLVSSAAYNWNKNLVMSETYGAMGNISWQIIYQVAMEQFAKGINMMVPHAVWYDTSQVVFRPELSYRSKIYADSLPAFNKFLARMHFMMQNKGYPVCDIAVLYPIQTLQDGHYLDGPLGAYRGGVEIPNTDYIKVSDMLTNSCGKDYMFLHPEILNQRCSIKNGMLSLINTNFQNDFRVIILPSCKVLSKSNLSKIKKFYQEGGTIIFTTQLPSKSTIKSDDSKVKDFIETLFSKTDITMPVLETANNTGGKAYFIKSPDEENLKTTLEKSIQFFDVAISPVKDIQYIHKKYLDKDIIYVCNLSAKDELITLKVKGNINFDLWNPHTGEVKDLNEKLISIDKTNVTEMIFPLPQMSSVFLVKR